MQTQNALNDNLAKFLLVPLGGWLVAQGLGFAGLQHVLALLLVVPFFLIKTVLSTLATLFGVTAAAAYINWTGDYQPQGRYLMVYLPILGTLIALYWRNLGVFWLSVLSMVPFALGLYSFYAVALVEISK